MKREINGVPARVREEDRMASKGGSDETTAEYV